MRCRTAEVSKACSEQMRLKCNPASRSLISNLEARANGLISYTFLVS